MSIGARFLERLYEAKAAEFTFDRNVEAMKRAMRDIGGELNLADKIAEVAAMCGIPGTVLNKPDVREAVVEAAGVLRGRAARVAAFTALHSALSSFHGLSVSKVEEAELSDEELEGQGFQKLVEECLASIGLPAEWFGADAKPAVKNGIKRMVSRLRGAAEVKSAFNVYARKAGIKLNDGVVGSKRPGRMTEAEEAVSTAPDRVRAFFQTAEAKEARAALENLGVVIEELPSATQRKVAMAIKAKLSTGNYLQALQRFNRAVG